MQRYFVIDTMVCLDNSVRLVSAVKGGTKPRLVHGPLAGRVRSPYTSYELMYGLHKACASSADEPKRDGTRS